MEQQNGSKEPLLKESLLAEFEAARLGFHALLDSLSHEDLQHASHNPAWTNQQIVFHMALGFFLIPSLIWLVLLFGRLPDSASRWFAAMLNAAVGPFNAINSLGPKAGGNVLTPAGLAQIFDRVHGLTVNLVKALPEETLARGMYYPDRWDPLFHSYMTLGEILHFPMIHFYFHVGQITRSANNQA